MYFFFICFKFTLGFYLKSLKGLFGVGFDGCTTPAVVATNDDDDDDVVDVDFDVRELLLTVEHL